MSIQDIYRNKYIDILLSYKNDIVIFFKIQVLNVVNYFQQFQHPFDFWVAMAMEVSFSLPHLAFQSLFSHHLSVAK
jgi:hypothetical protein